MRERRCESTKGSDEWVDESMAGAKIKTAASAQRPPKAKEGKFQVQRRWECFGLAPAAVVIFFRNERGASKERSGCCKAR